MSFIASMVAAAGTISAAAGGGILGGLAVGATGALGGAGLGAAGSAIAGDDPLEGAKLGAGIGSAVFGGLGALGSAGVIGGAGGAAAGAGGGAAAGAAPVIENAGLQSSGVVTQGLGVNAAPITGEVTSGSLTAPGTVNSVVAPATNPALTSAANPAPVVQGPVQASQGTLDPTTFAAKNVAANEANASWGSQLLSKAGIADAGQTGNAIGGKALENAVYGAGINGLLAGAQGQDVGKAMGIGALSGGIGGAAGAGLAEAPGAVGEFAAAHPMITSGAIGMGANTALNGLTTSNPSAPDYKGIRSNVKWNPNVYKPYGPQFAAGGITDLDNYDQTPQMQSPGTLDTPNRNEVANNQGYMGDSVQLMAHGGISDLGGYSDGGRLLKGPGDGVSDDIPASIGGKQPARLAEGEFVIPARIVSELGNGSTDAGAKRLYQMMDRIQSDRRKTTGKGKFSDDPKAYKHLPA